MSVKLGKRGDIPNWIAMNDWSAERRLEWAKTIMATSPRDWSRVPCRNLPLPPRAPDPELWALWCLVCCETPDDAMRAWWDFCDEAKEGGA